MIGLDRPGLMPNVRAMRVNSHRGFLRAASLLAASVLALPAATQPWETVTPKTTGLRPLIDAGLLIPR